MVLPKKWGQGQLFAFSALDGTSYASNDFVGILSGDRIGIKFFTNIRRELAIVNIQDLSPTFEAVTGDYISINTVKDEKMHILYADTHLIIGNTVSPAEAVVFTESPVPTVYEQDMEIQDTANGEVTALYRKGKHFAFAFGNSRREAIALAQKGIAMNFDAAISQKRLIYEKHSLAENNKYAALYAKCISVMKTQLYSPEGPFKSIWSTPDRLPHRHLWLWDSVFHAIGHANFSPILAQDLILALFQVQSENGFIPHMASVTETSAITQPPVIAWGAYHVFKKSGDKNFLTEVFTHNKQFLLWCRDNRRDTAEELYTWLTGTDKYCRCDECGMDNSPRFDESGRLEAIDYSCFMANDVRFMKKIAEELNDTDSAAFFDNWYQEIKDAVNEKLWCEKDGFYYDYDLAHSGFRKIQSVASFLPLFAGICDEARAMRLYEHLTNPETFYTEFPIPSISKKDAAFGSDMWRGPVWINYNYMILTGLREYGFADLAKEIADKTIDIMNTWYQRTGTLFEFYDCENKTEPAYFNRKGQPFEPYDFKVKIQSIRDYGWSCTLLFDLLCQLLG